MILVKDFNTAAPNMAEHLLILMQLKVLKSSAISSIEKWSDEEEWLDGLTRSATSFSELSPGMTWLASGAILQWDDIIRLRS